MADYVSNYSGDQIDEAVGRALPGGALDTGKAPAGFGLGGAAIVAEDANTISANGYYTTTVNGPGGVRCYIYHMQYPSSPYAWQYASTVNDSVQVTAIRHKVNGTWGEWEWVNPPMHLGVEYRTTERYQGKPVYAKLVDFGVLPVSTTKDVSHGVSSISFVIYKALTSTTGDDISDYDAITNFLVTPSKIRIKTIVDMSDTVGVAHIKYTKSTD